MSGPPPVVARARNAVRAALTARLEELADSSGNGNFRPAVLVGVSGGADSLALAATTQWVASRMGLDTIAGIVDHSLQEGSASVAERAKAQCERLELASAHVLKVTVEAAAGGTETPSMTKPNKCFWDSLAVPVLDPSRESVGDAALLFAPSLAPVAMRPRECGGVTRKPSARSSTLMCGMTP